MVSWPIAFIRVMGIFSPVCSRAVWSHVNVLLPGAVLAPGKRTVTAMLPIMSLSAASDFQTYHRVLNGAVWSPRTASRLRLRLVVAVVIPRGVVLCGLEETIERRRGDQLHAKGLYRDPVRSSHSQVVNVSGLPWLACMVLTPLSGANRVWAWPLLTVLGPSARFYEQQGRRHQTLTEQAWQMRRLVVQWLPGRELVLVADSSFAALELLDNVTTWPRARVITRLRLDAAFDDPSPPRAPWTTGRPRRTGKRRPTLAAVLADDKTHGTACLVEQWYGEGPREVEVATDPAVWYPAGKPPVAIRWVLIHDPQKAFAPQVLLSTHPAHTPAQMLPWVVRRWTLEVTVEEARAPLRLETPRQGNDRAMARTTPARLSLSSIITLTAHRLIDQGATGVRRTAWDRTPHPTFADAMALVRRHLGDHLHFSPSPHETDMSQIPRVLLERFTEALCDAA
jgi:DDE superfamily endonuclease